MNDNGMSWEVISTNCGYAICSCWKDSSGDVMRQYIAQCIPDKNIAKLLVCAHEMKNLLEDVADYIADGFVDVGAGYQDIEGQSLYREICDLFKRLE